MTTTLLFLSNAQLTQIQTASTSVSRSIGYEPKTITGIPLRNMGRHRAILPWILIGIWRDYLNVFPDVSRGWICVRYHLKMLAMISSVRIGLADSARLTNDYLTFFILFYFLLFFHLYYIGVFLSSDEVREERGYGIFFYCFFISNIFYSKYKYQ
jgi:hypothetical protein